VEQGTHNHLLKNKGPYNQLASGLIDKPSVPVKGTSSIPDFDGTLINLSYLTILFDVQRGFPSLYNSRLTINSAVLHTSQAFMKHIIVSNIHMQSMNRPVEEEFYVLESADSIEENDSVLTKSEYDFREFAKRGAGDLHHVDVTNPPLPDTEVLISQACKTLFHYCSPHLYNMLLFRLKASRKFWILQNIHQLKLSD